MKPNAVQYPHSLSIAVTELARASARHGVTAYAISFVLAALTLAGSVFYKEITHTFSRDVLGVRAVILWEALALVGIVFWLVSMMLSLMCLPQKGRARTFAWCSIGMNLAALVLVICTVI